jgi:hypothetical protein
LPPARSLRSPVALFFNRPFELDQDMNDIRMLRAALAAATLWVAALSLAVQAQVGAPAVMERGAAGQDAAGQPAFQVGDRLVAPAAAAPGAFREITWDDLIPTDWKPEAFLADLKLDELQDADPRASEAMQRMREEWDRAPVVERLAGASVRIPGFVVPLETDGEQIREFLLVPYFGACVHVPPPPANQLIHVIPDKPVPAGWNMLPVWVEGVMAVGRVDSEMGVAGYQLRGMKVEEYQEPLPK